MLVEFFPGQWCYDRYAKECERCDTVIGRYGVMQDEQGWRHITWWPHKAWDGVEGSFRCAEHPQSAHPWLRLVE